MSDPLHWRTSDRQRRNPLDASIRWLRRALGRFDHEGPVPAAFPNGHFYSPVPNAGDLAERATRLFVPREVLPGIHFDADGHEALIADALPLARDFDYPDRVPGSGLDANRYFLDNSQFSGLDARALFALLRHWQPRRVIEVGSGYSTLLMADVNRRFLAGNTAITCIEPYPRPFLRDGVDGIAALRVEHVQDTPLEAFAGLQRGDVLFIDSSHVAKTGSDVVHLLLDVVPRLASGVRIHVHDVFLPDEYPAAWVLGENRGWNEQYLLRALLTDSPMYRVLFAAHYASRHHGDALRAALALPAALPVPGGGSFWFERT